MGTNLSLKEKPNTDEEIMADIYNITSLHNDASASSNVAAIDSLHKFKSSSSETRHSIFDSKLPDDLEIDQKRNSSILQKMGNILKKSETQIDEEIAEKLMREELEQKYTLDVLLLGSEKSGKSVIFKQMEKAFEGEMDEKQREYALKTIGMNIIQDIVNLSHYNNQLNNNQEDEKQNIYKLNSMELQEICFRISSLERTALILSKELALEIYALWNDHGMQETFKQTLKLNIMNENTAYFLDKVREIIDPQYIVTFDDYVRIQDDTMKRSGVSQKVFLIETEYGKYRFNVTQINQQKSQQKRWMVWLDSINVAVFVVNLSLYDTVLYDDKNKNCLQHSMDLFSTLCRDQTLYATDFVVIFNKLDEFNKKIEKISFTVFKEDFDLNKANKSECVEEFVMNEFIKIYNKNKKKRSNYYEENQQIVKKRGNIYFHGINDNDTEQIGLLLQKVQTNVITSSMKRMGYVF